MSEAETESTPLDELKELVKQIEVQKRNISIADELPKQAKEHAKEMFARLTGSDCILSTLGGRFGGWPDFIKHSASDGLSRLKVELIDKATVERDRRVLVASLEINALALKIDKLGKDVARSLIVTVPPANEG